MLQDYDKIIFWTIYVLVGKNPNHPNMFRRAWNFVTNWADEKRAKGGAFLFRL